MLRLAPCEGTAHTGETTLTADELQILRAILERDDVEKKDVRNVLNTLKPTLNNEYDQNLLKQAEQTLTGQGSRSQTLGQAINYVLTIMDRVFPRRVGGQHRTRKYHPKKYYAGLSNTQKAKRYRDIQRFAKMSWRSPRAYTGFKTDKNVKTKTSSYVQQLTRKFKRMGLNPDNIKSLKAKAKATGVPLNSLKTCYNRGMAAWRTGHRPGATEQQWGYARVASLLVCGKTAKGPDSDIVRKAKKASVSARRWWAKCN